MDQIPFQASILKTQQAQGCISSQEERSFMLSCNLNMASSKAMGSGSTLSQTKHHAKPAKVGEDFVVAAVVELLFH